MKTSDTAKYKAILFSPDGEWVTDCAGDTIADVCEQVADMGSRWIFYPYPLIIKYNYGYTNARMRIVSSECSQEYWEHPNGMIDLAVEKFIGKSIKSVSKIIREY